MGLLLVGLVPAAVRFAAGPASEPPGQGVPPEVVLGDDVLAAVAASPSYLDAVPVLTFHDIDVEPRSPYSITPEQFATHMAALDQAGFHTVSLADVADVVAGRRPSLPPKPILITFDDGARGVWTWGDPILARHGFRAVAFVVTSPLGQGEGPISYYMDWPMLRQMVASGRWEVGGHTHNGHRTIPAGRDPAPWLTNVAVDAQGERESIDSWEVRVSEDLAANRAMIERELGVEVSALAYPFSAGASPTNDERIPRLLRTLVGEQFSLAFTSVGQHAVVLAGEEPLLLPRLRSVTGDATAASVLALIADGVPQPPPPDPTALTWKATGTGSCTSRPGAVTLEGAGYTTCRPEVTRTERWVDYTLRASVPRTEPGTTQLLAVRAAARQRVEVAVGAGTAVLRQQIDGVWSEPIAMDLPAGSPGQPRVVALTAAGGQAHVVIDGVASPSMTLDPALGPGVVALGLASEGGDQVLVSDLQITNG